MPRDGLEPLPIVGEVDDEWRDAEEEFRRLEAALLAQGARCPHCRSRKIKLEWHVEGKSDLWRCPRCRRVFVLWPQGRRG